MTRKCGNGRQNDFGCKSGDTLGNLANGCAVGRNGKYAATGYHRDSGMHDG